MQETWYLGEIAVVSIWFRMVLTQIVTQVYKYSIILTFPPNIINWIVFQFDNMGRFFDIIIDVH